MEHWYIKPAKPAPLHAPPVVDFLHSRYGFLLSEPRSTQASVLPLNKAATYRIVGLPPETTEAPPDTFQTSCRVYGQGTSLPDIATSARILLTMRFSLATGEH